MHRQICPNDGGGAALSTLPWHRTDPALISSTIDRPERPQNIIPTLPGPIRSVLGRTIWADRGAGKAICDAYVRAFDRDVDFEYESSALNGGSTTRKVSRERETVLTAFCRGVPDSAADLIWRQQERRDEVPGHLGHIIDNDPTSLMRGSHGYITNLEGYAAGEIVCLIAEVLSQALQPGLSVVAVTATPFDTRDWKRTGFLPLDARDLDGHDREEPQMTVTIWIVGR